MTVRVTWRGSAVSRDVERKGEAALRKGAEFLLEESNRTVPIEEGTLGRSGGTDQKGLEASVYYDTKYARRQHEETRYAHDPGRRAKWLELTLREQKDKIVAFIGRQLGGAFR